MINIDGSIRPFRVDDVDAVAELFQSIMRSSQRPATDELRRYIRQHFIDAPFVDPAIPSLVYEHSGAVQGFIGVTVQDMLAGDRPVRAALSSALMVRDHAANPMAGARLLRSFLNGAQDLSLAETAGEEVLAMLRRLRSDVLVNHSLDWVRIISPARYGVHMVASRVPAARLASPLARLVDRRQRARKDGKMQRWTRLAQDFRPAVNVTASPLTPTEFAALARELTASYPIRPVWSDAVMAAMLAEMAHKSRYGRLHLGQVHTPSGQPLAVFAYHLIPGGVARVLQILARPGQEGAAIDALLSDAAGGDAIAVQGRTDPRLLDALLSRRVLLAHESASILHTKDRALAEAFLRGDALFNGLVGERWSRLVGDGFD